MINPQCDAEYAFGVFFDALEAISEKSGKLHDKKRVGTATVEDECRLSELRLEWEAVLQEIVDVQKRLTSGEHALQPRMN